jgi:stress response protein SCP2
MSPRRNAANAPPLFLRENAPSNVPVNTLPRQRPSSSDAFDKVSLSKNFQATDDNPFLPNKTIDEPNSNTVKYTQSTKVAIKDNSALPKSAYQPRESPKTNTQTLVASASLFVTVLEGRKLVPMQRNMLGFKTHSHPYVEAYVDGKLLGKTLHAYRTVNPAWKSGNSFSSHYDGTTAEEKASRNEEIELRVYHLGKGGVSVFMGAVRIPLLTHGRAEWYPVQQRSALESGLYCLSASGELKVQVNFTAHSYPELKPGHELPISGNAEISLNLSWSGDSSLETSCVALDRKNGHVLWKECVYFANRINLSSSVARPEVRDHNDEATRDSLLFDFGMVPENVAAFYFVLTIRDKSCTLSDIQSFQLTIRNESTRRGLGRLSVNFTSKDTSAILLRIARSTMGTVNTWKLTTIIKGYKVFREFGRLLPQLQDLSSDILPQIGTPTERTALMRCGDSLQLLDYVPDHLPSKLVTGFFWKVKNKEPLKVAISLLDEELREVDTIHRTQPGALMSQGVLYSGGNEEYEKFEIAFSQLSLDVHYICFVLGPCSRQKVDDIENVACHIVNPALGAELARCTLSNFESVPTKSVGLGCFYKTGKGWSFTILGLCSTDTTFAGRLSELRTHIFENPLEPAISLPHPRLLKSVMPPAIPLPPPRQLALSDTVEAYHKFNHGQNVCTSTLLTVRRQSEKS